MDDRTAGTALYSLFSLVMLGWIAWLFIRDWPRHRGKEAERRAFEAWLEQEQMLTATWDEARNCYAEFPAHLAWRSWQARAAAAMAKETE